MDAYKEEVKSKLVAIPDKGKVLFAILICERLYPNYVAFQKINNWGDHSILQEGIALIRQYLIKEDLFDVDEITNVIESINEITPSTEDFSGIITSFALDACTAVLDTLEFLVDKNPEHIADVATYARDTVDMYIQEKDDLNANDPMIEEKIAKDPFMVKEKSIQRELLKKLTVIKVETLTDNKIESLKDLRSIIDLQIFSIQ
jgi:hypothetical protein